MIFKLNWKYSIMLWGLMWIAVYAQAQQTFGASVMAGINASQIRGDDFAGYNKLGLHAGVRGIYHWKPKMDWSVGIEYSQRGSSAELIPDNAIPLLLIKTDFIDVPLTFHYKDWLVQENGFEDYYHLHFHAGLIYSRLINASAQESAYDFLTDQFQENLFGFLFGVTYYTSEFFGITARFNQSTSLLFDNRKNDNPDSISSLKPFWLCFRVEYTF